IVGVRRVDEVDAGLARFGNDARRGRFICRTTEHHGAEANRRNLQAAAAELAVLHLLPLWSSFRGDAKHRTMERNCAPENLEIPGLHFAHPGMTLSHSFFSILNTPLAIAMTRFSTVTSVVMKIRLLVERTTRGREISTSPILPASTKWVSSCTVASVGLPET